MPKPILLTVDDEPNVLNAVERDLRAHYGASYQIIKASSGAVALKLLLELKKRTTPVALLLVDQRMPGMSGTELLIKAARLYPDARKVLLTAYADTEAAIDSINRIGLNYYLMKPWDPPELNLYPILDDLLADWNMTVPVAYDGIRVAGTQWSAKSHAVKDFLGRNRIPYQWLDIEKDPVALELVESVSDGQLSLPVVFFPDGTVMIAPDNIELAGKAGLQTQARETMYDVVIIGAGPAGLGAAVYAASEGLRTLIIEKEATGGQAGTSSQIENYLGFPGGVSGAVLAQRATDQARRFGAEILLAQEVTGVRVADPLRFVILNDGTEIACRTIIIATGVSLRRLDVPGVDTLTGAGVYYGAAMTEAAYYKGEHIVVVGGANSAGQGAMFFSRYASQVTMLVRGSSLQTGMSQYLVHQIMQTENIDVRLQTEVVGVHGENRLETITIRNRATGLDETLPAAAMFIFIGAMPHTEMVAGVVERNREGFIYTGPDLMRDGQRPRGWPLKRDPYLLETSVPGIFAAGDVRHDVVRRVASAVGQGAIAVSFIHLYLKTI
jgi:thioredoxin reductase (NADPH)